MKKKMLIGIMLGLSLQLKALPALEEENPYILTISNPAHKQKLLLQSHAYKNVRALKISGLDLDDAFVQLLSKNETFKRVTNIDLSNNPKLTEKSLQAILDSVIIGSVQEVRQPENRFQPAYCEIYVSLQGTNIKNLDQFKAPRQGFTIEYLDSEGRTVSPTESGALKYLKFAKSYS